MFLEHGLVRQSEVEAGRFATHLFELELRLLTYIYISISCAIWREGGSEQQRRGDRLRLENLLAPCEYWRGVTREAGKPTRALLAPLSSFLSTTGRRGPVVGLAALR